MPSILLYIKQRDRGLIVCLLLLAAVIYLPFLNIPFFFDDSSYLTSRVMESTQFQSPQLDRRWLSMATLSWTWKLFLDEPIPHRLCNMLLHASNAVLIFMLLKQLISGLSTTASARQAAIIAWVAAMVFCVHPMAVYAVGYVIQRSILLATLFVLGMHICYIKGLLSGKVRWLILSFALYCLAIFSKEHALMAVASLVIVTIPFRNKIRCDQRAIFLTWLACLVAAIALVSNTHGIIGVSYEIDAPALLKLQGENTGPDNLHLLSITTQMWFYFKYLCLWLVPNPAWMSIDMREPILLSFKEWQTWAGPIAYIGYGMLGLRFIFMRGNIAILGWAMLFPWLLFWTEFSTIRIQEPFVLYRSYLWFVGFTGALCYVGLVISPKKFVLVSLVAILVLIPLSWNRLWTFADSYRLWNDAALLIKDENIPGAARIYYNRGNAELAKSQWQAAIEDFHRVIKYNPRMEAPYNNLGIIHFNLGNYPLALDFFDQAIARNPNFAPAYFGKSATLKRLNQEEASDAAMQKSCHLGHYIACAVIEAQPR